MKNRRYILFIVVILIFLVSCSEQEVVSQETSKPVKILAVKEEKRQEVLDYTGMVQSDELKKISFKSPGRIEKIYVEKGEKIEKDQVLAQLDTHDLEYALEASKARMDGALDAYDYSSDNYKKIESLYQDGAISRHDFDKARFELDIRTSELDQAKADYDYKISLIEDATITSDIDGYVVDILSKEGEMISAGYPVIVIRSEVQVVNVGLSNKDVGKVRLGTGVIVKVDDIQSVGEITNIAQVPDDQTLTYNVEIILTEKYFNIGSIVGVQIIIGEEKGIWIPITAIMADGEDYVFIAKEDRAEKRKIIIDDIRGSHVKVRGINSGEQLVIEGMRRLEDGDRIVVLD